MKLIHLADGIDGLFIENKRFSTTQISVNLYVPLTFESLAANALLAYLFTSCCEKYPQFEKLNLHLSYLYGAELGGSADKSGDVQIIKLFSFCLNNELTPNGENIIEQTADLLCETLFHPSISNGAFLDEDVERERRLTLEKIVGLANDKRNYAIYKTIQAMYKNEAFGQMKFGSYEDVQALTPQDLYRAYLKLMQTAKVRIQVIGPTLPEGLFQKIAAGFTGFDRKPCTLPQSVCKPQNQEVARIYEKMDVTQGKLVLGFAADEIVPPEDAAKVAVFSDILGGGPYSKCFANVREKMSLCYYCAARANRTKGYMLVDSGVEPQNTKKTEQAVLKQLQDIQAGNFEEDVLTASKRSIVDSLSRFNDSQAGLDGWYTLHFRGEIISPEQYAESIKQVTREDVIAVANSYRLDTVFVIEPEKKGEA